MPPVDEVTSAATEAPSEAATTAPPTLPDPAASAPDAEPVEQQAPDVAASEPVANQAIVAPKQEPKQQAAASGAASGEAAPASEPAPDEKAPSTPPAQPAATPPPDHGRHLAGKDSYVVRPGDCLWHIGAGLLPSDAATAEVAREVERLWRLNEDRIGSSDPNLIYAGTTLRLR